MKRGIILLVFILFITSIISAEIIINQQPNEVYSLGDPINIPIKIKALSDLSGSFEMNLLCNGHDINFYKNGVQLSYGEEEEIVPSLILTKEVMGDITGTCKIKAALVGEEPQLTNEFRISNVINLEIKNNETEFTPGESILIDGHATKENNKDVNGFIGIKIISSDGKESDYLETIGNGFFSANISLEKEAKAGEYKIKLNAYERNFLGETTNQGFFDYTVLVLQVPTSLEILFENTEVEPGTNLKVKAILRDQTGEKIGGVLNTIKIVNDKGIILEQTEKLTDEFLEFPILYNEPPAELKVIVQSGQLTNEAVCEIIEKKEVNIEIINKTLIITNVGNVYYNDTISVKIGNQTLNIDGNLEVDEVQKYILTAPNGEYSIEVTTEENKFVEEGVMLTGDSINIKKAGEQAMSLMKHPIVWVFVIILLILVAFIVVKKGYKKSFFGYIYPRRKELQKDKTPIINESLTSTSNKAELSLSLKGEKQNASLICLKLRNLKEIKSKKGSAVETLQKIMNLADSYKSAVYENNDNMFFILAPIRTRTFGNEKNAVNFSQKIKELLIHHNRTYNQKINFGIGLNYGAIVAKQDPDSMKFMSMGTFITNAKKIANVSNEEVLLSDKIKERVMAEVKTEKHSKDGVDFYIIKEIKDSERHKQFINRFMERMGNE